MFSISSPLSSARFREKVSWSVCQNLIPPTTRRSRVGKLFWESTAATTSTMSTTTQCFVVSQTGALIACTRKRRAVTPDTEECDSEISASRISNVVNNEDELEGEEEDVQPGMEDTPNRQARSCQRFLSTSAPLSNLSLPGSSSIGEPQHRPPRQPHSRPPQPWPPSPAPPMASPCLFVAKSVLTRDYLRCGNWRT